MASDHPPDYAPFDHIAAAKSHGLPLRQSAPIRRGPVPLQLPLLTYLKDKRVILASASPRRRALLTQLGFQKLEILPSTEPEDLSKTDLGPEGYVGATARRKCLSVYRAALEAQEKGASSSKNGTDTDTDDAEPALVVAADTVVVTRDGAVLEKPRDEADHGRMLRRLRDSGWHRVLTSVCVLAPLREARHPGYVMAAHTEETRVCFARATDGLPDDVIDAYVRTREGADKAGGYAIQGIGGMILVDRLEGRLDNVVGLPVKQCLQLCEKVLFKQDDEDAVEGSSGDDED